MHKRYFRRVFLCLMIAFGLVLAGPGTHGAGGSLNVRAASKIKLSKKTLTLYVKESKSLKLSGTSKKVTWSSSNKKVAKVTKKGKVTAVKKGKAVISAKVSGKKYTCKIMVKNPTLSASSLKLSEGSSKTLMVSHAVGKVTWSSSKSSVAAVSQKGLVRGKKAGTTTITALASGIKLTCKVTVTAPKVPDPVSGNNTSISVSLETEPGSLDPAMVSTTGEASIISHLFSGLARWAPGSDGYAVIVPDMAESLPAPVNNGNGTYTYTYKIRSDALWSDGQPVTASDFVYAWKRAAFNDQVSYGYLFESVDGYDKGSLNVKAKDDRTLTVTTAGYHAYWEQLLAFPVYFPVREDAAAGSSWASQPASCISNGMYTLTGWDHDAVITVSRNDRHPQAAKVTMKQIRFILSGDEDDLLRRFNAGELALLDSVPAESINQTDPQLHIEPELGTYYLTWNIDEDLSPKGKSPLTQAQLSEVRGAINLLIDRNHIVNDLLKMGQTPASSLVPAGIRQSDGSQFYKAAGHSSSYPGYYSVAAKDQAANVTAAKKILAKYYTMSDGIFTDFPEVEYLINDSSGHRMIADYIKEALGQVGINVKVKAPDWGKYQTELAAGHYTLAKNAWIADYEDALNFLELWVTGSNNNSSHFGENDTAKGRHYSIKLSDLGYADLSGDWSQTYDVLITHIRKETRPAVRDALLHRAEDLIMQTGCISPLYYYTRVYLLSSKISGFYTSPTGVQYFMFTK